MSQHKNLGTVVKLTASGTDKGTLPAATALSGTVTTNGTLVIGTGTTLRTDFAGPGDFLYAQSINEVRRVFQAQDEETMILETAFSSNVTAEPVQRARLLYTSVSVTNTGASDAGLQEGTIAAGETESYNSDWGVEPMVYAASGNDLKFDLVY